MQTVHGVVTAKDAQEVAGGRDARQDGCENPKACQQRAVRLLEALEPKWDPRIECELHEEETNNGEAEHEFPRQVVPTAEILDLFRVFTEGNDLRGTESHVVCNNRTIDIQPRRTVCMLHTKNMMSDYGVGVWFKTNNQRNAPLIPPEGMDNEVTLVALEVQRVLECTHDKTALTIVINSKKALKALTTFVSKNEDLGWPKTRPQHKKLMQGVVAQLRRRKTETKFKLETSL